MKLYSLRRGFLHRVHCRRPSPLSTRMRSLRRELLFGRCANETSSWIRPLVLQPTMLDLGVRASRQAVIIGVHFSHGSAHLNPTPAAWRKLLTLCAITNARTISP